MPCILNVGAYGSCHMEITRTGSLRTWENPKECKKQLIKEASQNQGDGGQRDKTERERPDGILSLNPVSLCSQLLTNKSSFNLLTIKYLLVNILTNKYLIVNKLNEDLFVNNWEQSETGFRDRIPSGLSLSVLSLCPPSPWFWLASFINCFLHSFGFSQVLRLPVLVISMWQEP